MQIFAVGIDVVVGNSEDAFIAFTAVIHSGLDGGEGGILSAKDDFIDFALTRRELAVCRNGSSDVGGIA